MNWSPLPAGLPGCQARGRSRTYLVTAEELEGQVHSVRLARWLTAMTSPAVIAVIVARTAITLPLPSGYRTAEAVREHMELAKAYAEDFERGQDIPLFRQWQHTRLRVLRKLATDADH